MIVSPPAKKTLMQNKNFLELEEDGSIEIK